MQIFPILYCAGPGQFEFAECFLIYIDHFLYTSCILHYVFQSHACIYNVRYILNNNPFRKPRGMHPTGRFMMLASKTFAATLLSMRPIEHFYP